MPKRHSQAHLGAQTGENPLSEAAAGALAAQPSAEENAFEALREGIEHYLACVQLEKGLSQKTQDSYSSDLEQFAHYATKHGLTDWKNLTMAPLSGYMASLAQRALTTSSVARKITALRTFLRFLYKEETLTEDLADRLDVPKLRRRLPETMTEGQFEELLAVMVESTPIGLRDRAIIEMLYGCGLRISELTALRITDISDAFDFVRALGKGSKERMVPMGSKAAEAVKKYITLARPQLVGAKTDGTLFITQRGTPISRKTIWAGLKIYASKAHLSVNLKPHLLRHSFATQLLQGGADLRMIQELLGHSDIATTQIYTAVETSGLTATHALCHPRTHLKWSNEEKP